MGYGLSVFRVPQEMLARAFGRNDAALLAEALEGSEHCLADYDEQLNAPDPNADDENPDLSHADALREIFAGHFTPGVRGSRYGWAFECLCGFLGDPLDNDGFVPCDTEWFEELDRVLSEHGVPVAFNRLINRAPIAIPESDDWPCVGHWGPTETAATEQLEKLANRLEDGEVRAALTTAAAWLRISAQHRGSIIVGFYG